MGKSCTPWDKSLVVPNRAEDGEHGLEVLSAAPLPTLVLKRLPEADPRGLDPSFLVFVVLRAWAPQAFRRKFGHGVFTEMMEANMSGSCPPPKKGDHKGHDAKVSSQLRGTCNHRALRSKVRHPSPQSPCGCPAKLQEGSRSSPAASGDPQKEALLWVL